MHKNFFRLLLLAFVSAVTFLPAVAGEIRVFKLSYASPYSVAGICENLFGKQGTFVASPQINALVVNTDDKELFMEIEKLLAALDRKPATLRFTVKSLGSSSENLHQLKIGSGRFPKLNNERHTSTQRSERSVTALEFARASFTDEQIRVFSVPAYYGNELVVLATSHGLKVSGHVNDAGRLMLQVWYAEGSGNDTESLLTELEVEPGQWAEFGGLTQGGSQKSDAVSFGKDGSLQTKGGQRQTDRRFAIRADLIR